MKRIASLLRYLFRAVPEKTAAYLCPRTAIIFQAGWPFGGFGNHISKMGGGRYSSATSPRGCRYFLEQPLPV